MKLEHPVKDWLSNEDIDDLFSNSVSDQIILFNSFANNLEKLVEKRYPDGGEDADKFKGDLFELFVEFLLKYMGHDTRIGVKDYRIIQGSDIPDYGVDGFGISTVNSYPVTVQAKYRQANYVLQYNNDKVANLITQSIFDFFSKEMFIPSNDANMFYVTSGKDFHYSIKEITRGTVRCIGRDGLRELVDNVAEFWKDFRAAVIENQVKVKLTPKNLRQHQVMAVNSIINDMRIDDGKGVVILPTGTGKTLVQAQTIIEASKEFGYNCFVIFSPRILLSFQHLCSISEHLTASQVDAHYLNLNSGSFDESIINEERRAMGFDTSRIISTTKSSEVKRIYEKAKAEGKILVISSTYHSAQRIREATINIDMQLNDEAHNMVSREFNDLHGIGKNEFSFTATEKVTDSDQGLGMRNESLWGNMVFNKLPKEMIDAGEILPVTAMVVRVDDMPTVKENDYNSIFRCVKAAFACHKDRLVSKSADPGFIGAKLLITVDGQETLRGILSCDEFDKYGRETQVKTLAISSEVGMYINGNLKSTNNRTKEKFLKELQGLSDTDEAIIFYVDMLTEGIDVPGITAFMPLRGMCEGKFLQGMGRTMRLFQKDRLKFYDGKINPSDQSKYIKPEACVIVSEAIINTGDNAARYCRLWQALYDNCGIVENVVFVHYNGIDKKSSLSSVNRLNRKIVSTNSGVDKFLCKCLDRPDLLDIDEILLVTLCMKDENLAEEVFDKMKFNRSWETYLAIAQYYIDREGMEEEMIKKSRKSGHGVFSNDIKKKFGTIYTPEFVVRKTIELAWKYLPKDKNKLKLTYLDPASGDGNFLEILYEMLMKEESISDPVKRSHFILTKCVHGVEILKPMVQACKIRLAMLHFETVKKNGGDPKDYVGLLDELNIWWGNTIVLPEDTEQEWYKNKEDFEGGILSENIRNRKWDCIVSNPPYSHLRNMDNRRYKAYPRQRDMAQVFVRWGLDHLSERGVISYNTTDTWLIKVSDGALETRIKSKLFLREIIQSSEIETYSQSSENGGFVGTFIVCLSKNGNDFYFNNKIFLLNDFDKPGFLLSFQDKKIDFHNVSIKQYCPILCGNRSKNKQGTFDIKKWRDNMVFGNDGDWYLIAKRRLTNNYQGSSYKLLQTINLKEFIDTELEGEIKAAKCQNQTVAKWLVSFLNTKEAAKQLKTYSRYRPGYTGDTYELSNNLWPLLLVPDYEYYLKDRPEKVKQYLSWIEENMIDKDKFLAGIDEQFELLIGD